MIKMLLDFSDSGNPKDSFILLPFRKTLHLFAMVIPIAFLIFF